MNTDSIGAAQTLLRPVIDIMTILLSTGTLYGLPLPLSMQLAKSSGCDGIELILDPLSILGGPGRVRSLSERFGVKIPVLHPPLFGVPGWNPLPIVFEKLAWWAVQLGSSLVVMHAPPRRHMHRRTLEFDQGLSAFNAVARGKARVSVENIGVFSREDLEHPYVRPEHVRTFAQERGLGVTFDTTHAASAGLSIIDAYEAVADAVEHVHLSDFKNPPDWIDRPSLASYVKHHQVPGRGALPLAEFVGALCSREYKGAITLELSPVALKVWRPSETRRLLEEAVGYVRGAAERWERQLADVRAMGATPEGTG